MSLEADIRDFLSDNFILEQDISSLPGDESLTGTGVIDSMGVLEIIMFLEERYGITVSDEETLPENLDTIDNLVRYVETKRGSAAGEEHGRASRAVA